MVLVEAVQDCFVNNCYRVKGTRFEYDGVINEKVMLSLEDNTGTKVPKQSKATKAKAAKAAAEAQKKAALSATSAGQPPLPKTESE